MRKKSLDSAVSAVTPPVGVICITVKFSTGEEDGPTGVVTAETAESNGFYTYIPDPHKVVTAETNGFLHIYTQSS